MQTQAGLLCKTILDTLDVLSVWAVQNDPFGLMNFNPVVGKQSTWNCLTDLCFQFHVDPCAGTHQELYPESPLSCHLSEQRYFSKCLIIVGKVLGIGVNSTYHIESQPTACAHPDAQPAFGSYLYRSCPFLFAADEKGHVRAQRGKPFKPPFKPPS